jgi:hypothetical protein
MKKWLSNNTFAAYSFSTKITNYFNKIHVWLQQNIMYFTKMKKIVKQQYFYSRFILKSSITTIKTQMITTKT